MDPISYGVAAKQKQRIEKVIAEPDSDSGIVTTPSTIAVGETITIPAGRTAVLPNTTVNGTLDVQGEVFIPSGSSYTDTEVDATVVKQNGSVVAVDSAVVHNTGNEVVTGIKTFSSFPLTPSELPESDYQVANKKYVDSKGVTGVRQTVQYASTDQTTGLPNFITAGTGLTVNILATTTNIKISAAGGDTDRIGKITADTTITGLSDSATNYLYADIASDGTLTFATTTYAPIYQQGGVPSTTSGQHTFNIGEMKMYVGNGSTYTQVFRVFIGECVTGSSIVTSVTNYALNGYYDSGWIDTLPTAATAISKNCNIGSVFQTKYLDLKCRTADAGYLIGDILSNVSTNTSSGSYVAVGIKNTSNTVSFKTGANGAFVAVDYSTGSLSSLTLASWAYKIISKRNW